MQIIRPQTGHGYGYGYGDGDGSGYGYGYGYGYGDGYGYGFGDGFGYGDVGPWLIHCLPEVLPVLKACGIGIDLTMTTKLRAVPCTH